MLRLEHHEYIYSKMTGRVIFYCYIVNVIVVVSDNKVLEQENAECCISLQ